MPCYRRYVDGRGFYIIGRIPGMGFSTWQIGKPGVIYLAQKGIKRDGDFISPALLRGLNQQGLVTTGGEGVSAAGGPVGPNVAHLVAPLEQWAQRGEFPGLDRIIHGGSDFRMVCFSSGFIKWLSALDDALPLPHFDGITLSAFEVLTGAQLDALKDDPLHRWFVVRGSVEVLWRLARVVGLVARQLGAGTGCPAAWELEPVLAWLCAALRDREGGAPAGSLVWTRLRTPPRIEWRGWGQEEGAVFPAQPLPHGAERITWAVGGRDVCPRVVRKSHEHFAEESKSAPLWFAEGYTVEARFQAGYDRPPERWSFALPGAAEPLVLFRADGALIDPDENESLLPGTYRALIRKGQVPAVRARPGVALTEPVEVEPLGWSGWSGWCVTLAPGAAVGPFRVAAGAAAWELEPPPEPSVQWLDPAPVWLGAVPRVYVSSATHFRGATLEVSGEGGTRHLLVGTDVPLGVSDGRAFLDLAASALKNVRGTVVLTCRPVGQFDREPLVARFVRFPALELAYIPDDRSGGTARAVRVRAGFDLRGITPDADTGVGPIGPREVVLRSRRPVDAPGVIADLPDGGTLRVRVPVTRAGRIDRAGAFAGWQPLPLPELDLADVHRDDRVRVEFHDEPPTEDGKLLLRVPGSGELLVGTRRGRAGCGVVYEIDLHRLRDGFGIGSTGAVQVRGPDGWVQLFALRGLSATAQPVKLAGWQHLLANLGRAVAEGNRPEAMRLAARCLEEDARNKESQAVRELLTLGAAGALLACPHTGAAWDRAQELLAPLADRSDLPDAAALAFRLRCRADHQTGAGAGWNRDRVNRAESLPACPDVPVTVAEAYYNFARFTTADAAGCWRSCEEFCARAVRTSANGIAFSDALVLGELARVMVGTPLRAPVPSDGLLAGHAPWLTAVRFLGEYISKPWPRPVPHTGALCLDFPPPVLRSEDVALLRAAVALAQGAPVSEDATTRAVLGWPDHRFDAIGLLRARRARLAGDRATANAEYRRLAGAARPGLLDVIADEQFTT